MAWKMKIEPQIYYLNCICLLLFFSVWFHLRGIMFQMFHGSVKWWMSRHVDMEGWSWLANNWSSKLSLNVHVWCLKRTYRQDCHPCSSHLYFRKWYKVVREVAFWKRVQEMWWQKHTDRRFTIVTKGYIVSLLVHWFALDFLLDCLWIGKPNLKV